MSKQHDTGWIQVGDADPHRTITRDNTSYTYLIEQPADGYQNVVRIWHDQYNRATEKSGADEVIGCIKDFHDSDSLYGYVEDAEAQLDKEGEAREARMKVFREKKVA